MNTTDKSLSAAQMTALRAIHSFTDQQGNMPAHRVHAATLRVLHKRGLVKLQDRGYIVEVTPAGAALVATPDQNCRTGDLPSDLTRDQIESLIDDLMSAKQDASTTQERADRTIYEAQRARRDAQNSLAKITKAVESLRLCLCRVETT